MTVGGVPVIVIVVKGGTTDPSRLKSVTHLYLNDSVRQLSRWYFSLKSDLLTEDPLFG